MCISVSAMSLVVGIIFGGLIPLLAYLEARQRVRKLENIITLHETGESVIQAEAKKIKIKRVSG
jgi:hypothetical protein